MRKETDRKGWENNGWVKVTVHICIPQWEQWTNDDDTDDNDDDDDDCNLSIE